MNAATGCVSRAVRPGVVLGLVCGAQFMVVLDLVVVNIALPSIQADLGLSSSDLEWIVIAYGLTFGGFLLLGGRAADLVGRRTMLVAGLSVFTAASFGAGASHALVPLLACRAVQGLGAATTAPAALSILTSTFAEGAARNRALGVFGGVAGAAASGGLVVGGLLSGGPGWPWIFFVNVPIGTALVVLVFAYVPNSAPAPGSADVLGAATVTAGLLAIVFAVSKSVDYGWTSPTTLGFLLSGLVMLALFMVAERRASVPLIQLSVFRSPTLTSANIITVLVMGSFFGFAFQVTLFLQQVLGYSPTRAGAALVVGAASSVVVASVIAPRVVGRVGVGLTLVIGQGFAVASLLFLARAPVHAGYWCDLFPGFLGLGIGIGLSGVAVQIAAFIGVKDSMSGIAGGVVQTAQEIGSALGLAVIATAAIARSNDVLRVGGTGTAARASAQTAGFHRAALVAAGFSVAAAIAAGLILRRAERAATSADPSEPKPVRAREAV